MAERGNGSSGNVTLSRPTALGGGHGVLRARPEKWGPRAKLDGAAVACTHAGPNSVQFVPPAHAALVFFTMEPQWQIALNSDRRIVDIAPMGSLEIVPAQNEVFAGWTAQKHSLRLDIDPLRLQRLAGMEFDRETFELRPPKPGLFDEKAHTLACWMRHEIQNNELGAQENLDALATVFALHLLRNHSSLKDRPAQVFNGGLQARTWRRVNDFIQEHLSAPLSLERLASIANLSPTHFVRAFKRTTGQSPHQYVISSRLSYARGLIVNTDTPLSRIAELAGFSNHSHMTAVMQRTWGTTPTEFRRKR
ncbi:helix-turn-helix domain-containing protein [Rhizobium puerariae]|uniref:Helix-turn-helix domain-containing protein n=1 Tax=Rhizobium puerariae TaxID=1585791 RepID=A0ABV6AEI9_9HYPH